MMKGDGHFEIEERKIFNTCGVWTRRFLARQTLYLNELTPPWINLYGIVKILIHIDQNNFYCQRLRNRTLVGITDGRVSWKFTHYIVYSDVWSPDFGYPHRKRTNKWNDKWHFWKLKKNYNYYCMAGIWNSIRMKMKKETLFFHYFFLILGHPTSIL